ncbi:YdeI/OmpD-associated family protein [Pelagibacterium sp. H642]|uniref:YdeI/OmpD-associated family protein n=1 Tax=Pelagibacterium sp. H642 TaxID=1881069 RepID=UPI002815A20A|nr:YdeI/OmpD-associated family protein [Pelagibacterium sp. H642]WMT92736.1 YdeI/OmpD-associated family protein [Pelagibacterium sp. H642]
MTSEDERNSSASMFRAQVIPSGNATGVVVPDQIVRALGPEGRPPVTVTINGFSWRTRVAAMRGQRLVGISAAQRTSAGIAEGDLIDVKIERDDNERSVPLPQDIAGALEDRHLAAFERLPFGLRQKHVRKIQEARSPEVRTRRIRKLVEELDR